MVATAHAYEPVMVEPGLFDFGEVEQGTAVSAYFQVHNTSERDLSILLMEFSDPGLLAMAGLSLPAGSSIVVQAHWNTAALVGPVEGRVTLDFREEGVPDTVLLLKGTVVLAEPGGGG